MPTSALASIPRTHPELLSAVRRGLIDGQREIDRVWVHSYHETGRLITEHILLNERGAKVYHKLARRWRSVISRQRSAEARRLGVRLQQQAECS